MGAYEFAKRWSATAQEFINYVGGTDLYAGQTEYSFVSARDLTKLWIGNYDYLYRNMNDNSERLRGEFTSNAYGYEEGLSTLVKALDVVHTSRVAS